MRYHFEAPLWEMDSMNAWVFVTLPLDLSEHIKAMPWPPTPGFGSLRVRVTVGGTEWATSIFPDKHGYFVLPVKKAVRHAEGIEVGDVIAVGLELVDGM